MRILMQNRRDVFKVPGGDTLQMLKTKEFLEKNYDVTIDISTELAPNVSNYDIVHLFNVTRVHETFAQLNNAKKQNKKVIVSPIYHSLDALANYEENGREGSVKLLNNIIANQTMREAAKNLIKGFKDPKQFPAILNQIKMGYIGQQKFVLENADLIYVIASEEYNTMKKELKISNTNFRVVPNGVDFKLDIEPKKMEINDKTINLENFVLSVARIENRKNQIKLINAMEGTDIKVVFVGGMNTKQKGYFNKFKKLIDNKQFYYLGKVEHEELLQLFQKAKAHVLPSWFEVVPLVDIEAQVAGTNIVTTKYSYIMEYLDGNVYYCDPNDIMSIKNQVIKAYSQEKIPNNNIEETLDTFSWNHVAKECFDGYNSVLK